MEVELLQVEPGQIINEYDIRKTDHLYSSYIVLRTRGYEDRAWECLCIFNGCSHIAHKAGDTPCLRKDWLANYRLAKQKDWPTFWRVESGH